MFRIKLHHAINLLRLTKSIFSKDLITAAIRDKILKDAHHEEKLIKIHC